MSQQPRATEVQTYLFKDDGGIPNNPELPLLGYLRSARLRLLLLALDELYTVAVWVLDEEEAGAATHGVRLALEVHATRLF